MSEQGDEASKPVPPPARAVSSPGRRLDPLAVRRELREDGLRARRELSQNFLADPDVLEAIVELADPAPGRRILEIGPGLGILTRALVAGGAEVTAVELDRRLAQRLADRIPGSASPGGSEPTESGGTLRIVQGDVLDLEIRDLIEPPYDVVANIPYHITSPILHRFLGGSARPERLVLMVQREVAERISASPGAMSYLSVFVQYHAAVRIAFVVPREAFEPAPDVESAVVVLEPRTPDATARASDEDELWRLVQAGFRERRKMLRNVLTRQLPYGQSEVDRALAATGIAGDRRPQTLSVGEWLALRHAFDEGGKS